MNFPDGCSEEHVRAHFMGFELGLMCTECNYCDFPASRPELETCPECGAELAEMDEDEIRWFLNWED